MVGVVAMLWLIGMLFGTCAHCVSVYLLFRLVRHLERVPFVVRDERPPIVDANPYSYAGTSK